MALRRLQAANSVFCQGMLKEGQIRGSEIEDKSPACNQRDVQVFKCRLFFSRYINIVYSSGWTKASCIHA